MTVIIIFLLLWTGLRTRCTPENVAKCYIKRNEDPGDFEVHEIDKTTGMLLTKNCLGKSIFSLIRCMGMNQSLIWFEKNLAKLQKFADSFIKFFHYVKSLQTYACEFWGYVFLVIVKKIPQLGSLMLSRCGIFSIFGLFLASKAALEFTLLVCMCNVSLTLFSSFKWESVWGSPTPLESGSYITVVSGGKKIWEDNLFDFEV